MSSQSGIQRYRVFRKSTVWSESCPGVCFGQVWLLSCFTLCTRASEEFLWTQSTNLTLSCQCREPLWQSASTFTPVSTSVPLTSHFENFSVTHVHPESGQKFICIVLITGRGPESLKIKPPFQHVVMNNVSGLLIRCSGLYLCV